MTKAYILICVSYLLALAAAWITLAFVADYHLMIQVLIADVVATIVIFAFSVVFKNSSFYDAYWSVIPMVIVGYLISLQTDADRAGLLAPIKKQYTARYGVRVRVKGRSQRAAEL